MEDNSIFFIINTPPVSINRSYQTTIQWVRGKPRAIFYLTKEGKQFKNAVQSVALKTMNTLNLKMLLCPIILTAVYYFKTLRPDVTNYDKALLDGMEGVCFKNDSQIYHATFIKFVDRICPRTEITIKKLETS